MCPVLRYARYFHHPEAVITATFIAVYDEKYTFEKHCRMMVLTLFCLAGTIIGIKDNN